MAQLIQHFVTRSAAIRPDNIAIVWNSERIPYLELDQVTNQIAHTLRSSGCRRGDRVVSLFPKSANAIMTMIGILKADGVCVPVDADNSAAHVAEIIKSAQPKVLLATRSATAKLDELCANESLTDSTVVGTLDAGGFSGEHFGTEFCGLDILREPTLPRGYENSPSDIAQLLFSTESTDEAKGIIVSHAEVTKLIEWTIANFPINEFDRVSGQMPSSRGFALFETWGAFAVGAELHPVSKDLNSNARKIADFIRTHELTQWLSASSILDDLVTHQAVKDGDFPALKRMMWCGEVLPTAALIYLMERLPLVQFTNLFGPTEAISASAHHTVTACPVSETAEIPVGQLRDGVKLFVLDNEQRVPPIGEVGDLYIAGVGLSSGYWRDQAKTDAVFLKHPVSGQRIFKTGNLAKVKTDGLVYLVRRVETQMEDHRDSLARTSIAVHSQSSHLTPVR